MPSVIPSKPRHGRFSRFTPEAGAVYRTADLLAFTKNPSRLAKRLVHKGALEQLGAGLYGAPRASAFGKLRPNSDAVLRAFLKGTPFLVTGPGVWNALGLGSTAVYPSELVYNTMRSGEFTLAGRRYRLMRRAFPEHPTPEWYAIDLIEHRREAGVDADTLVRGLRKAIARKTLSAEGLRFAAARWGGSEARGLVDRAMPHTKATGKE